jgi:hypothetical protein
MNELLWILVGVVLGGVMLSGTRCGTCPPSVVEDGSDETEIRSPTPFVPRTGIRYPTDTPCVTVPCDRPNPYPRPDN